MPAALDPLMEEATRYAEHWMKKSGSLAPSMMAVTAQGMVLFLPSGMKDEQGKNDFANTVRLICAAHAATAVVLIVESWVKQARPGEKLDLSVPPSQSHDREEVVVLIGQGLAGNCTRLLPIVRSDNGRFWNLGDAQEMPSTTLEGRFAGLLPPKPVDEKSRQMSRLLLQAMGVKLARVPPRYTSN